MPVTYLDSTLTSPLPSVENKGLTENLNPLDATLTKNMGEGVLWLTRNLRKDFYPEKHRNERSILSSFPTKKSILAGLGKSRDLTFLYVVTYVVPSLFLP
jgi:hypothetical protein